jgi:hypothetical protein
MEVAKNEGFEDWSMMMQLKNCLTQTELSNPPGLVLHPKVEVKMELLKDCIMMFC